MDSPRLQFTKNGTFQVTVFSDLHFAENERADVNSTRVMHKVLTYEDSQIVVLNGDLISGEATNRSKSSEYVDQIVAPLVNLDMPWASTYGNHDSNLNLDPEQMFNREKQYPNSLTASMVSSPFAGVTNYYLPVFNYNASNESIPAAILWFFDSRGGRLPLSKSDTIDPILRPNWVDDSVVEWFNQTNANLTSEFGRPVPSIAFVHIPVYAMRLFQKTGVNVSASNNIDSERVQQQGYNEGFDYDHQDFPFMQALLDTPGLIAVFSGHDHGNDWCFKWSGQLPNLKLKGDGVNLCYGRHTGYGGYGDWARGGRQVLLDQRTLQTGAVHSWIRLENGTVSGDVRLNASNGHDPFLPSPVVKDVPSQSAGILSPSSAFIFLWVFFILLS